MELQLGTEQPLTRNEQISVSTNSIIAAHIRPPNEKRKMIVLRNTSDNEADIITIHIGKGLAKDNEGIVLHKNEFYSESQGMVPNEVWQWQISTICATANGKLSISER